MFDAWQAQQRAQKEEERKAKTAAAAALQGYRRSGLSEEETKLAALREQERLQKLSAEQQLHGYRSKLSEADAKLAAQRQEELRKKQAYEEQLRNNGVVSSHDNAIPQDSAVLENSGAVSALAAGYSSPDKVQAPKSLDQTESSAGNTDGNEQLVHSKVKFMFGILTSVDSSPKKSDQLVEGYLARADQIAKSVISSSSSFDSILPSMSYPKATNIKKDPSRSDASRSMVTVAITYSAPDEETSRNFKSEVIARVRAAIDDGSFTKLKQ